MIAPRHCCSAAPHRGMMYSNRSGHACASGIVGAIGTALVVAGSRARRAPSPVGVAAARRQPRVTVEPGECRECSHAGGIWKYLVCRIKTLSLRAAENVHRQLDINRQLDCAPLRAVRKHSHSPITRGRDGLTGKNVVPLADPGPRPRMTLDRRSFDSSHARAPDGTYIHCRYRRAATRLQYPDWLLCTIQLIGTRHPFVAFVVRDVGPDCRSTESGASPTARSPARRPQERPLAHRCA